MPSSMLDFISSLITPAPKPVYSHGNEALAQLPGMVLSKKKLAEAEAQRKAEMEMAQAKLQAAGASDAAQRKQQMEIERLKEGGRGSRAEMRGKSAADKLALDRERFNADRGEADNKVFSQLADAEAKGDRAMVAALHSELQRRGYTIGSGSPSGEAAPENVASYPDAQGSPRGAATPQTSAVARFPDVTDAQASAQSVPEAEATKPAPGEAMNAAGKSINGQFSELEKMLAPGGIKKPAPGDAMSEAEGKIKAQTSQIQGLSGASQSSAPVQSTTGKPAPGDAMDEASKKLEGTSKAIDSLGNYSITKDGKEVYRSSREPVSGFQNDRVKQTFKSLADAAGDPWEKEAAQVGFQVAKGNVGAMSLEDAIKSGMEAYRFETSRRYRKDRVGTAFGGPGGGPALNKKKMDILGAAGDDMGTLFNRFQSSNNYKQMEQSEYASSVARDMATSSNGMANATALGQLIKASEGGRPTDADREQYLRGQGALDRLKRKWNELTKTGREDAAMTPDMLADIAEVAKMNESAAKNKRAHLAEEWDRLSSGMESLKVRYGDQGIFEKDKSAYKGTLLQNSQQQAPKGSGMTPEQERARRAMDEWKRSKGGR